MTDQVSRPVQILLAVTVLFAALWFVALRPKSAPDAGSSSSSAPATATTTTSAAPTAPGVAGLGRAIDQAHGAVATSDAESAKIGGAADAAAGGADPSRAAAPSAAGATPSPAGAAAGAAASPAPTLPTVPTRPAGAHGAAAATRALATHRVLAVLFYNPRASDDRAVLRAFRGLGARGVTFVAAPLSQLSAFHAVTQRVPVTGSPTFVAFDRAGTPSTLVGFSDPALMGQRLLDARAAR